MPSITHRALALFRQNRAEAAQEYYRAMMAKTGDERLIAMDKFVRAINDSNLAHFDLCGPDAGARVPNPCHNFDDEFLLIIANHLADKIGAAYDRAEAETEAKAALHFESMAYGLRD